VRQDPRLLQTLRKDRIIKIAVPKSGTKGTADAESEAEQEYVRVRAVSKGTQCVVMQVQV